MKGHHPVLHHNDQTIGTLNVQRPTFPALSAALPVALSELCSTMPCWLKRKQPRFTIAYFKLTNTGGCPPCHAYPCPLVLHSCTGCVIIPGLANPTTTPLTTRALAVVELVRNVVMINKDVAHDRRRCVGTRRKSTSMWHPPRRRPHRDKLAISKDTTHNQEATKNFSPLAMYDARQRITQRQQSMMQCTARRLSRDAAAKVENVPRNKEISWARVRRTYAT